MGADQSRPTASSTPSTNAGPEDFYTLLEVDDGAGELEIKKSFRKLALKWHPDKNPTRYEESTLHFAKLQEAYETLSDPQERAFYDRRRQTAALRGSSGADGGAYGSGDVDDVLSGKKAYGGKPTRKARGLGVVELERFFDKGVWRKGGLADGPGGFYEVYSTLFAHLSAEEALHAEVPQPPYPPFGSSSTVWSNPDRTIVQVRNFYAVWSGFSTEKGFEWVEQWDAERGDVRHVRRMMEKDNKKARDDAKREYNETVRTLVAYLRKRDPRMPKAPPASSAFPTVTRPTASSSGARTPVASGARPAQQDVPTFTPQAWQKTSTSTAYVYSDSDDESASDASDDGDEGREGDSSLRASNGGGEWECIACGKSGKSEGRWRDHERSKGHRRAIDRLRREMLDEDWELGLGGEQAADEDGGQSNGAGNEAEVSDDDDDDDDETDWAAGEDDLTSAVEGIALKDSDLLPSKKPTSKTSTAAATAAVVASEEDDEDDDVQAADRPLTKTNVPGAAKKARKKKQREEREARLAADRLAAAEEAAKAALRTAAADEGQVVESSTPTQEASADGPGVGQATGGEPPEMSKKDKRRERERKKAEAAAASTARGGSGAATETSAGGLGSGPEKCNICKQGFPSRTKLFDHIKATGHASLKYGPAAGGGKGSTSSNGGGGKTGDWSSDEDIRLAGKKGKKKGGKR